MSAEVVRQLCEEKRAADERRADLECLMAYMGGRFPDQFAAMLHQVAADEVFVSPTASALLAKLGKS